jgi:hypothetical protein
LLQQIEKIREFRTRLIAGVVLGQLDVHEAAERLVYQTVEIEPLDEIEDVTEDEAAVDEERLEANDAA